MHSPPKHPWSEGHSLITAPSSPTTFCRSAEQPIPDVLPPPEPPRLRPPTPEPPTWEPEVGPVAPEPPPPNSLVSVVALHAPCARTPATMKSPKTESAGRKDDMATSLEGAPW